MEQIIADLKLYIDAISDSVSDADSEDGISENVLSLLVRKAIDAVYSADPKIQPDAIRFEEISYLDVLNKDLTDLENDEENTSNEDNDSNESDENTSDEDNDSNEDDDLVE